MHVWLCGGELQRGRVVPALLREGVGRVSWVHIRYGDMIDSLNHLHSEVVYNAVMNMAQNPNLTVGDLHKLLDIIEQEVIAIYNYNNSGEKTCQFVPFGLGEMRKCSVCGFFLTTPDIPKVCPSCGRKVEIEEGT